MSEEVLSHTGIIKDIKNEDNHKKAIVEVPVSSACAHCKVSGSCSSSSTSERVLETILMSEATVGDRVRVEMAQKLSWMALLYSFAIPLVLIFGTFFGLLEVTNEIVAAIGCIAILVPYYGLLRILKGKLEKTFLFQAYKL